MIRAIGQLWGKLTELEARGCAVDTSADVTREPTPAAEACANFSGSVASHPFRDYIEETLINFSFRWMFEPLRRHAVIRSST